MQIRFWGNMRAVAFSVSFLSLIRCGNSEETGGPPSSDPCESDADCDDGLFCTGVELCVPDDSTADQRGCVTERVPCLDGQRCEEKLGECKTNCDETLDADGDGHDALSCGGDDCDDSDARRFPSNEEVCDAGGRDEDCDPGTFGFRDADDDGYPDAECCNTADDGEESCGTDCDDQDPGVHPDEAEQCNGLDDDCNGEVDDISGEVAQFWLDSDEDGFGDADKPVLECTTMTKNLVTNATDCDDDDSEVNPGEEDDSCNGVDNNCNGETDEDAEGEFFEDLDGDGYGNILRPLKGCRDAETGVSDNPGDCNDARADAHPGFVETDCDGIDNDCNGAVDESDEEPIWYLDKDGDGHGAGEGDPLCAATRPGYSRLNDDCDDDNEFTYPGATEICDRRDNDCSTGGGVRASEDNDDDGFTGRNYSGCTVTADSFQKSDCNDNDAGVNPDADELCDRKDSNCDQYDGASEDEDGDGFAPKGTTVCTGGYPASDCDDLLMSVNPDADDICNGEDDDCSGSADPECPSGVTIGLSDVATSPAEYGLIWMNEVEHRCPNGEALVGLRISWEGSLDGHDRDVARVRSICAPVSLSSDTSGAEYTYQAEWGLARQFGDWSNDEIHGGPESSVLCPDDTFVTGIRARKSVNTQADETDIYQFELACRPMAAVQAEANPVSGSAQYVESASYLESGKSHGSWQSWLNCPTNTIMTGLDTSHRDSDDTDEMQRIEPFCRALTISN